MLFADLRRKHHALFLSCTPKTNSALQMILAPSRPETPKKAVQATQVKSKPSEVKKTVAKKEPPKTVEKKVAPKSEQKSAPKQEQQAQPKKQETLPKKTEPEEVRVSAQEKLHQEFYDQLLTFWSAPAGMAPEKPCQVKAEIDWKGNVYTCTIESSSGIALYDISAQSVFYEMKMPQWTWGKSLYVTFNE